MENKIPIKQSLIEKHSDFGKVIFLPIDGIGTLRFEDYKRTILHDTHKCYNYKHFRKLFEKLEEDIQLVIEDLKKIQEVMF